MPMGLFVKYYSKKNWGDFLGIRLWLSDSATVASARSIEPSSKTSYIAGKKIMDQGCLVKLNLILIPPLT